MPELECNPCTILQKLWERPQQGEAQSSLGDSSLSLVTMTLYACGASVEGNTSRGGMFGKRLYSREELINRSGKNESTAGQPCQSSPLLAFASLSQVQVKTQSTPAPSPLAQPAPRRAQGMVRNHIVQRDSLDLWKD